jgi:predicted transcriptional regulator
MCGMSALKQAAHELVNQLPETATWRDLAYEIDLRRKLEEGLRDLDEGRIIAHEDVRRRFLGR